jgi:hypothetical protein
MHMKSGHAVEAVVALNIFEHKDTVGQSEEWLIDSAVSVHIVNDYTLLQNPTVYSEPRPLQLATEGVQSAITITGSVQHYPAEEVLERDYQRREAIEEKMLQ